MSSFVGEPCEATRECVETSTARRPILRSFEYPVVAITAAGVVQETRCAGERRRVLCRRGTYNSAFLFCVLRAIRVATVARLHTNRNGCCCCCGVVASLGDAGTSGISGNGYRESWLRTPTSVAARACATYLQQLRNRMVTKMKLRVRFSTFSLMFSYETLLKLDCNRYKYAGTCGCGGIRRSSHPWQPMRT